MDKRKQTKIVATISDLNCGVDFLTTLYNNGMNVVRLNTAHQSHEGSLLVIENVRKVSSSIPLLVDTKGPEVRTFNVPKEGLTVEEGEIIAIGDNLGDQKGFFTNYDGFVKDISVGADILIDDGETAMVVVDKKDDKLFVKISNSGVIKNKKSINTPGVHLDLPSISEKDAEYIKFAAKHNVEFIAHSFVRNGQDVKDVQALLDAAGSDAKIIAKIENREGVDNLEEILDECYGVMIARGDLGIEIPAQEVPAIQKHMIDTCIRRAQPVITATQMLHTMIDNPRPTRAEVSDVANAIFDGTDAIMLSGETAYGKYPLEAVQTMNKIALEVEAHTPEFRDNPVVSSEKQVRSFLAKKAVEAAIELPIKSIVVDAKTGSSARMVSSYRGKLPIYVKCMHENVMKTLALSYGVYASTIEEFKHRDQLVSKTISTLIDEKLIEKDDQIVILAGTPGDNDKAPEFIQIATASDCL
ncbi:pyruvate kinase [Thiospirochaeta perfilievii]|uniref:Pyruvate kinase n=1 Tax=Thiospirochaeta perfilievii TaxID=252967 RepID=A0A5C1QGP5_9SPIO|nr:pyruvate kinase [Thiospirochaeta perfilievii]QEN05794.1 pyruvate kinase [Thiospirochaeta perfilievii]